jgi:hypothetical protein
MPVHDCEADCPFLARRKDHCLTVDWAAVEFTLAHVRQGFEIFARKRAECRTSCRFMNAFVCDGAKRRQQADEHSNGNYRLSYKHSFHLTDDTS